MTTSDANVGAMQQESWKILLKAHEQYFSETPRAYDEVLDEVAGRIGSSKSIGKADIGSLLLWKRLRADTRWVRNLMVIPDKEVREHTLKAVEAANDLSRSVPEAAASGRSALSPLPGFQAGDALASALLLAAAPERMAVYDRRAQGGLEMLGLQLSPARGRYGRYMELVENIRLSASANDHEWTARDVDVALYWLGGSIY
ncbi:hypothetical protein J3A64_002509 [Pseudarthrobacter sp. PvP004]|uniref:hypothetical protein n=1 Tax=Pseudarthrobacter sp. PvP004 TaxID=2817850 RepID=UPI00256FD6C5|nr:hypothetical protein [Pseudarthrobacter sp. PvP004]MBP2267045.1 hypothetical protein [Pseudarthrobacter sp. PvP004]